MTREEALLRCQAKNKSLINFGWVLVHRGLDKHPVFIETLYRIGRYFRAMRVLKYEEYGRGGVTTA